MKNNQLLIASLALSFALFSPIAFAKAANTSQTDVNDSQANINADQADINANQANINAEQAKVNKNQANVNKEQGKSGQLNSAEHRSAVATFVQNLLNVADRNPGGIGDQVKIIANAQNDSKENVADAIDKIQNRNALKTFLIGTDYKNVGQLRGEMVKTENHINQLTTLLDKVINTGDKTALQEQIQTLKQEQQKINDFLKANEDKFSLLGWLVKLFNK